MAFKVSNAKLKGIPVAESYERPGELSFLRFRDKSGVEVHTRFDAFLDEAECVAGEEPARDNVKLKLTYRAERTETDENGDEVTIPAVEQIPPDVYAELQAVLAKLYPLFKASPEYKDKTIANA